MEMNEQILTDDEKYVSVGDMVYVYPDNGRYAGSIKERRITSVENVSFGGSSFKVIYLDGKRHYNRRKRIYSTKEAALLRRAAHKDVHPWMRCGKLYIDTGKMLLNYLVHYTGISIDQIDAYRISSGFSVCWVNNQGRLHKEKFKYPIQEKLKELVDKIKQDASLTKDGESNV